MSRTTAQLERKVVELEKLVRSLLRPKSTAKIISGQSGARLYRYTLNEGWGDTTADEATCDILELDGTDTNEDSIVKDPDGIFATLESGDPGWCFKQDGVYYAIQAPCPT